MKGFRLHNYLIFKLILNFFKKNLISKTPSSETTNCQNDKKCCQTLEVGLLIKRWEKDGRGEFI